jgi:hypothetical protein
MYWIALVVSHAAGDGEKPLSSTVLFQCLPIRLTKLECPLANLPPSCSNIHENVNIHVIVAHIGSTLSHEPACKDVELIAKQRACEP